jgi:hypothetical protein
MKFLLSIIFIFSLNLAKSQWVELANLGFPLRDVSYDTDTSGFLVGENGVFYTVNEGYDWNEITLFYSVYDESIYENTSFYGLYKYSEFWLAVGKDILNDKGVIFKMSNDDLIWKVVYEGEVGSNFSSVSGFSDKFSASGNNGLVVYSEDGEAEVWSIIDTGVDNNWTCGNKTHVGGEGGIALKDGTWIKEFEEHVEDFFYYDYDNFSVTKNEIYSGDDFETLRQDYIGDLNANCVAIYTSGSSTFMYIGTESGIYASSSYSSPYQWGRFPSSYGYNVNKIFVEFIDDFHPPIAVCEDGSVLRNFSWADYLPYTDFEFISGGCSDSLFKFEVSSYPIGDYNWYLDDEWVSDDPEELEIIIPGPAGYHEITLTRENGGTESVTLNFYVADLAIITETVSSFDSAICMGEVSNFIIAGTSEDKLYRIYDIEGEIIFDELPGSGGDITLNTGIMTDTTDYLIGITPNLAECVAFFPDTFRVKVDNPIANFKAIPLNAEIGENVYFNNLSSNATSYAWNFLDADATFLEALTSNTINSYSSVGMKSIELIASTENGCSDTIQLENLFSYTEEETPNGCWSHHLVREEWGHNPDGGRSIDIDQDNDIYIATRFDYNYLPSKIGMDATIGENEETHVGFAKYSNDGVLKWSGDLFNAFAIGSPNISVDHDKNVILSSGLFHKVDIKTPDGDTLIIPEFHEFVDAEEYGNFNGLLMKLDSNGNVLWYSMYADNQYSSSGHMHSCIDNSGNIYTLSYYNMVSLFPSDGITYVFDDHTYDYYSPSPTPTVGSIITKWSPEGEILWRVPIHATDYLAGDHDGRAYQLSCSDEGIVFLSGLLDDGMTVRTTLGDVAVNPAAGDDDDELELFIVALDNSGQYLWHNNIWAYDEETGEKMEVSLNQIKCDPGNGDLFVTGRCPDSHDKDTLVFESLDPVDTKELLLKGQFLVKYDVGGNLKWINSTENSSTNVTMESVGFDDEHNVYLSGLLSTLIGGEEVSFNSTNGSNMVIVPPGFSAFVNKYSSDGTGLESFFHFGNNPWTYISLPFGSCADLEVDTEGNIFGLYLSVQTYESPLYFAGDLIATAATNGGVIAKYDPTGCMGPYALLNEETVLSDLLIYPNPSTGAVYFKENLLSITLFDLSGKQVFYMENVSGHIDISALRSGMYIINATNLDGDQKIGRLVNL